MELTVKITPRVAAQVARRLRLAASAGHGARAVAARRAPRANRAGRRCPGADGPACTPTVAKFFAEHPAGWFW